MMDLAGFTKKLTYEQPVLEVCRWQKEDVIVTSGNGNFQVIPGQDEGFGKIQ